jgi:hypothetical protein
MRGKRAKALRRIVYGDQASNARGRNYRLRGEYQHLKRGEWLPTLVARLRGYALSEDVSIKVGVPAITGATLERPMETP